MNKYIYIYIYTHTRIHVNVSIYIEKLCLYQHIAAYTHTYTCIYICLYIYIYTYIYELLFLYILRLVCGIELLQRPPGPTPPLRKRAWMAQFGRYWFRAVHLRAPRPLVNVVVSLLLLCETQWAVCCSVGVGG